jgi:hypothetical protein
MSTPRGLARLLLKGSFRSRGWVVGDAAGDPAANADPRPLDLRSIEVASASGSPPSETPPAYRTTDVSEY